MHQRNKETSLGITKQNYFTLSLCPLKRIFDQTIRKISYTQHFLGGQLDLSQGYKGHLPKPGHVKDGGFTKASYYTMWYGQA